MLGRDTFNGLVKQVIVFKKKHLCKLQMIFRQLLKKK